MAPTSLATALTTTVNAQGIATLTLNRPDRHNAFDDTLILALNEALDQLEASTVVRAVILAATGNSFCAGADLAWMQRMGDCSEADNLKDARQLARLMHTLDNLSKPTIAAVQGPAYGGGVGLVACCDMVFAAPEACFALTEVRFGLIPAVISPYVVQKIGVSQARRYILSGERFDAVAAQRMGLVHDIAPRDELVLLAHNWANGILRNSPAALSAAKRLIADVGHVAPGPILADDCAHRIAAQRVSPEGQEGLRAFLEKRLPHWEPMA